MACIYICNVLCIFPHLTYWIMTHHRLNDHFYIGTLSGQVTGSCLCHFKVFQCSGHLYHIHCTSLYSVTDTQATVAKRTHLLKISNRFDHVTLTNQDDAAFIIQLR